MKIRALICVWLCAMLGLAMCGSGLPDIGLSSNRGQMAIGLRTSLQRGGGGGEAGWDTVVVIFSPGARVDSTEATGKWLFPVPTAYTGTDTTKNPRQNHRIWRLNDQILGRGDYPGGGSWRADSADTGRVLRLGTGKAVPTFAWANIKKADTNGYYPANYLYSHLEKRQVLGGVGYLRQTIEAVGDSSIIPMFYVPFEDHIPENSTIVDAKVVYASAFTTYHGVSDTIISVLMTNANDDEWYKAKGGTGMTNSPNYAHASWNRQTDDNADAWDGDEANAWSPGLTARGYYWSMGNTSDWTGSVKAAGYYTAEQPVPVDITDCVQAAVNGVANNGIIHIQKSLGTSNRDNILYGWDTYSTAAKREPYVVVKYITKRYQKPFGSADWAMVFQTDDMRATANNVYADTMAARGGKFTLFGFRQYASLSGIGTEGVNDNTRCLSLAERFSIYDSGNELGSHSKFHSPAKGYHDRIVAGGGIASAAYDSMVVDYGPNWMYAVSDSALALGIISSDLRDAPYYAKSFGAPVSPLEAYAQRVLIDHPYVAWRTLGTYATYDREKYYSMPPAGYRASADSAVTNNMSQYERHVRNIREQFPNVHHRALVGIVDSTSTSLTHLPKVAHNTRRLIEQVRGNDTRVVHFFSHDLKSGGSGDYTNEGMNADELGRICYVTNLLGGRYMTVSELGRWFDSGSTPIDYPFDNDRPDTFQIYASDRVWAKPDGIDSRWIRGVKQKGLAKVFDNTAPPPPTDMVAYSGDGECTLDWAASAAIEPVYYKVYRFFDGAADTTLLGTGDWLTFTDETAVNGSPHNYFVTAIDAAGNESADSDHVATTPGTILALSRPVYFGFWYEDASDEALPQADVDELAAYDAIVAGPHALELNDEAAYDGLLARIKAINPDAVHLTYFSAFTMVDGWAGFPAGSAGKRIWDYVASIPDSAGFAMKATGGTISGDVYPQKFYNITNTTLPDTIASILVDVFEQTGVDGEYAGFFLDDSDTTLSTWMCNEGACDSLMDFNGDETAFFEDDDEKAAVKAWHLDLVRAIRREFAERGMQNRLITANTTWGRKADPSPLDDQYMGLLDGMLNEGWNRYWPGPNVPTVTSTWDISTNWWAQLTHAQTTPPLVMWNAHTDSSSQYMNEVLAYAYNGFVNSQDDDDRHGITAVPEIGRKLASLTPTGLMTAAYDTVAANATADTLTVTASNLTARMVLSRNTAGADSVEAVWPYAITDNTKSEGEAGYYLSRSAFWEIPEDAGAPAQLQFEAVSGGDRSVLVTWNDPHEGDVNYFRVYRSLYDDVDSLSLLIQNPTAANVSGTWNWPDTTVTNSTTYYYAVSAVDYSGNESAIDEVAEATPADEIDPPVPQSVIASGGSYYIDLDWHNSVAADLEGYYIARAPNVTGNVAGTYTARYDSTTISAYQDSTALSGDRYWYKVRAYDDDANISAYSSAVVGSWSAPVIGAPTSLVAQANTPAQGSTKLSWEAPSDDTNLDSYTLYRDRSAPYDSVYVEGIATNYQVDAHATQDSTFYYSVTAVYDPGGESEHSNVVSMKNTDTVPPMTPTMQIAAGNGTTGIDLNWSDSASAVMYYVWRASAVIDSTTASAYTDTTAAQATVYTYGVKARDAALNMSTLSNTLTASWTLQPSTGPTIGTVSGGTIQHGEAVTLAGSNFGFKASTDTLAFDNLEDGSCQANNATVGKWANYQWPPYAINNLSISDESRHARSAHSATCNMQGASTDDSHNNAYFSGTGTYTKCYAQFWFMLDENFDFGTDQYYEVPPPDYDANLGNIKIFRMYNATENVYIGGPTGLNNFLSSVTEYIDDGDFPRFGVGMLSANTKEVWHLYQFEYKESSLGVANGVMRVWFDGQRIYNGTAVMTRDTNWDNKRPLIVGFYDAYNDFGTDRDDFYIDDVYVDNSWCRIELGNESTYAACTHREIQIPTSWSPTSIGITANTGSFENGTAYLFVVTEDGTVSAGKAITVAN